MFSGIITDIGTVESVSEVGSNRRLRIGCAYDPGTIDIGASIACSGVCLTVTARGGGSGSGWFEADLSAETLNKTTLKDASPGTRLNLERALRLGDELGGHMVLGHVDAVARIIDLARDDAGQGELAWRLQFAVPRHLAGLIAPKGSVTLDGTSLTVNEVDGSTFTVTLVPHTLSVTTWGTRAVDDTVNLEIDVLARYVARLAQSSAPNQEPT